MNLGKLERKLRREAAANPKKAILLGLVVVVALYLWTPLVRGWITTDEAPLPTTPDAVPLATATQPMETVPANQAAGDKTAPVQPCWQQVVQWMRKDPRTMIAPMLVQTRDPFQSPQIEVVDKTAKDKIKPKPADVGLVLTSTIIGPQRRVVQISGKTYGVGQIIEVANEKQSLRAAFKLVEVEPRRAVLEADGERFELTIPEPGKSSKIEFLGAAGSRQ